MPTNVEVYMEVGGTIPGMESVESSRDAYMDVGGRKRPEHVFERRPRKRREQVFDAYMDVGGRKRLEQVFQASLTY